MRLWSIHPSYLDNKGLVALWREGLLAQAVLADRTVGYRNHSQLIRFKAMPNPSHAISAYLYAVYQESVLRGYNFNQSLIDNFQSIPCFPVTSRQLDYEMAHLQRKVAQRNPSWYKLIDRVTTVVPHPVFEVVDGPVESWEIL